MIIWFGPSPPIRANLEVLFLLSPLVTVQPSVSRDGGRPPGSRPHPPRIPTRRDAMGCATPPSSLSATPQAGARRIAWLGTSVARPGAAGRDGLASAGGSRGSGPQAGFPVYAGLNSYPPFIKGGPGGIFAFNCSATVR